MTDTRPATELMAAYAELYDRILTAATTFEDLAEAEAANGPTSEFNRLEGKRQGLLLAADYLRAVPGLSDALEGVV